MRHEKYKMVVTVDIDTDRLVDIFCNAALVVIACIILVAYIVPLVGELPEFDDDCVNSPETSDVPCPPIPSAAGDQTFPLERPSWKP